MYTHAGSHIDVYNYYTDEHIHTTANEKEKTKRAIRFLVECVHLRAYVIGYAYMYIYTYINI